MRINPGLLRERGVPADAQIETWESVIKKTRQLGRLILESCGETNVKDRYPRMLVIPRGGYFVGNLLSRAFGYSSDELLHLSLTSYGTGETESDDEFRFGQMPVADDVRGKNVLAIDEVCDSGLTLARTKAILAELGANDVITGVLHYKPKLSKNGFVPDFYVAATNRWVVYPWEPYETLGAEALDEGVWLPDQNGKPPED